MTNRFIILKNNIILELRYLQNPVETLSISKIDNSIFFDDNFDSYIEIGNRKLLINDSLNNPILVYGLNKQSFNVDIKTFSLILHFGQNFVFNNPISIDLKINQLNSEITKKQFSLQKFILSDLSKLKINANPFIRAGQLFNSYYEIKIPSIEFLEIDWIKNGNSLTSISRKIFGNFGINATNSVYEFEFSELNPIESYSEGCKGSTVYKKWIAALPKKDNLESLFCFINESNDGDFIQCGLEYSDGGISSLLQDFNSIGKSYYITHEISIAEFIPIDWRDPSNGNWEVTDTYQIIKSIGDYQPFIFRPILKRDDVCPMFKINYIGKLIDSESGDEIWKESSFISTKTRKYGKKYPKFELYQETPEIKIIEESSINILNTNNTVESFSIIKTELIPVWFNELNIETGNLQINSTFKIPHFSNSYIVEFYFSNLDSLFLKNCILEFINIDGSSTTCSEIKTTNSNLNGHISFQISENEAQKISSYTSKSVRIIKTYSGGTNVLAFGTWEYDEIYSKDLLIENYKKIQIENLELKKQIKQLETKSKFIKNFEIKINPFEIK